MLWLICLLHSGIFSRPRRPVVSFKTELLGILRDQPLPTLQLHRVAAEDAADGIFAEKAIQNIKSNVPAGGAPRDEAPINVGPQGQACAIARWFKFPAMIAVLKKFGSVGSRDFCCDRNGVSNPGEIHRGSSHAQVSIDDKGC